MSVVKQSKLFCDISGEGSLPIVFLHGFTLDHKMWKSQIDMFQCDRQVLSFDIPGFGESEIQSSPDIHHVAIQIRHRIRSIVQQEKIILCGLSMGGYLALEIARCFPEDIAGLILSNTECRGDSEEEKKKRDHFILDIAENGSQSFLETVAQILPSPTTIAMNPDFSLKLLDTMKETSDEALIFGLKMMRGRPDYLKFAGGFHQPVLFIAGGDDQMCSLKDVNTSLQAFPNAELQVIEDTGHLTPMENPIEFNKIVFEFINEKLERERV